MEHIDLKPNSLFLEKGQVDWTHCDNQGHSVNIILPICSTHDHTVTDFSSLCYNMWLYFEQGSFSFNIVAMAKLGQRRVMTDEEASGLDFQVSLLQKYWLLGQLFAKFLTSKFSVYLQNSDFGLHLRPL